MATILVDYENIIATDGLKGVKYLNEKDKLIIFYSQCCEKIRAEYVELIEKSNCEFKTYKLVRTGKNALDFYIATECGELSASGENQIIIISKDKGFAAVKDFFQLKTELKEVTISIAPNIESALVLLNTPEDKERKDLIKEKTRTLSIGAEQARINTRREFVNKIVELFEGTKYEKKTGQILELVEERNNAPKSLYTGSLHEFGRKDGREIYWMLKKVV